MTVKTQNWRERLAQGLRNHIQDDVRFDGCFEYVKEFCTSLLEERDKKSYRKGFIDGFMQSGEGWNAEYPFMNNKKEIKKEFGHLLSDLLEEKK